MINVNRLYVQLIIQSERYDQDLVCIETSAMMSKLVLEELAVRISSSVTSAQEVRGTRY